MSTLFWQDEGGWGELLTVIQGSGLREVAPFTGSLAEAVGEEKDWRALELQQKSDTGHYCSRFIIQHQSCGPASLQRSWEMYLLCAQAEKGLGELPSTNHVFHTSLEDQTHPCYKTTSAEQQNDPLICQIMSLFCLQSWNGSLFHSKGKSVSLLWTTKPNIDSPAWLTPSLPLGLLVREALLCHPVLFVSMALTTLWYTNKYTGYWFCLSTGCSSY